MIQITSVQPHVIMRGFLEVEFILFGKFKCESVFNDKDFEDWDSISKYVQSELSKGFNDFSLKQLEGKPSNLKTK